ncbi:unnamed protein product [Colletotrichum noveboracense]|uniref:Uncharacterized protein n=1 Tax=Colletotrichum noveboracense TaxID=2664923 RepID=A0A9W4S263_9PEZI|nr:unnamed protein product [Colletotrichum noveboracense]
MSDPTSYEPFVTTLTLSLGAYEGALSYTFAPQTTPFTPPSDRCSAIPRAIRCQDKPEELTSGAICLADQIVDTSSATLPTECFPETYDNIWRPVSNKFRDLPNLAYPGSACISGWTTACITTVSLESAQHLLQTWCCPSGWSCLTVSPGDTPYRDCVSYLSTPTEVWVNNLATSGGTEVTLWSSWRKVSLSDLPSSGPLKLKHPPFPLYGRLPSNGTEVADKGGLSTGAIAGIVVGIVLVILILIGIAVFVCVRRRKERAAAHRARTEVTSGDPSADFKGPGYDAKQELPGHSPETRELQTVSPPPVELSSQTKPSEVEGQPPVELAS